MRALVEGLEHDLQAQKILRNKIPELQNRTATDLDSFFSEDRALDQADMLAILVLCDTVMYEDIVTQLNQL